MRRRRRGGSHNFFRLLRKLRLNWFCGICRHNSLLQQREKLEDLEKALKEEQMRMALEKEQHRTTAAECCRLRDEKDW